MIDIERLHKVATSRPFLPRNSGKTYFGLVCLVQKLELLGKGTGVYVCANICDVGNNLGMLISICKDLDIKVLKVTHNEVHTEFGSIRFLLSIDRGTLVGLHNHIIVDDDL